MADDERQSLLYSSLPNNPFRDSQPRLDTARRETRRFLTSKWGHYSVLLLVGLDVTCIFADFILQILTCEARVPPQDGQIALDALSITGLVFSCLFVAELLASVWAFGPSFFHSKFHCFDAVVIITSFVVDVLLRGVLEEIASIVIVLRLWRVFKIIEELSVSANDQMEEIQSRLEAAEHDRDEMKLELNRLRARYFGQ